MNYSFDFRTLIGWCLPRHKRRPIRIAWLYALLAWIRQLHTDFIATADQLDIEARVNGQLINIEEYIISRFGDGITLSIKTSSAVGSFISASDDPAEMYLGDGSSVSHYIKSSNEADVNFTVNVPASLDIDEAELSAVVNKYKLPGGIFNIIRT